MNSKKTIEIWSRVLAQACAGKTAAEQKKIIARLQDILEQKKKEYLLAKIMEKAAAMMAKSSGLEITFAREQPQELVEKIKKKLKGCFDGEGHATIKIDPGLIGGFMAKTDQYLLKASVRDYLSQLKRSFES